MQITTLHILLVLWLNFLLAALPPRVVGTYAELLVGAMLSASGHITEALLAVGHKKHFSTYYWLIEQAKWSYFAVTRQVVKLILTCFPRAEYNLIVDDFVCPRSSKEAPQVQHHAEHSQKPNRPRYIWGQQWLAVSLALSWGRKCASLPLLLRLHKKVGNRTKLIGGVALIRSLLPSLRQKGDVVIRCLVDAWYMKRKFVLRLLKLGVHVIGQARKDTVLYLEPQDQRTARRGPGRPRKYGDKLTKERVEKLPLKAAQLHIYGGLKVVKYRAVTCLARFLHGHKVMAIWCQLPEQKSWTLLLSTDLSLTPERIIKLFARRWKIEPMFNEIKHGYGVAEAWEQTEKNLHRWVSMLCVAYTLHRTLSLLGSAKKHRKAVPIVPWRANRPITAGMIRLMMQLFFRQFSFSRLWQQKSRKFVLPER